MRKIAELLLQDGFITQAQLEEAIEHQKRSGNSLAYDLVYLGYVTDQQLAECLGKHFRIPAIDLTQIEIEQAVLDLVPAEVCRKYQIIPIARQESTLTVAIADPTNILALDDVSFASGYQVEVVAASEFAIRKAIEKYYGSDHDTDFDMMADLGGFESTTEPDEYAIELPDLEDELFSPGITVRQTGDVWKTIQVFVSSNFAEMSAERKVLQQSVFPQLREKLLQQRIHLIDYDPRSGTDEKQANLDRIIASQAFIGILGERFSPQTASEILYAIKNGSAVDFKKLFYFRNPDFLNAVPDHSKAQYVAESAEAEKLKQLKDLIYSTAAPVREYHCHWSHESQLAVSDDFRQQVVADLMKQLPLDQQHRDASPERKLQDTVDCTAFAPRKVAAGETFLVQVFAHLAEQAEEALRMAVEFDEAAERRGVQILEVEIAHGMKLTFDLSIPGLAIDDSTQSFVWKARTQSVQFSVTIPDGYKPRNVVAQVTISSGGVPLGHIKFKLTITDSKGGALQKPEAIGDEASRYRMAFISYASEDRPKVASSLQVLKALGIRYFQDVINLEPGDRWEKKLFTYIDHCDLFFLFWSSAAKASEWVRKEVSHALARKVGDDASPPLIRPIIIEGPQLIQPWPEIQHLHFYDPLVPFLNSNPPQQ